MIKLSKSCISEKEVNSVSKVLKKEYLGMGEEVKLFESKLKSFFNRDVVCVANGTSALQLSLEACGIGLGDDVLVPTVTYVASYQAIAATGAKPISCDINPDTGLVDLEEFKKRITKKTAAIMLVHFTGGAENLDNIYLFAEENNLRVIEDAAHAFGSLYENKKIGSFGDIVCFSFDGIKNITSGEGGCIVTADIKVIDYIKDARLLGVMKDSNNRFSGKRSWDFQVENQGWRYHMSNIMASIGIEQLKRFEEFSQKRKIFARHYDRIFEKENQIKILKRDYNYVTPHIYVIRILNFNNRESFRKKLLEIGIETGLHYKPNHLLKYFNQSVKDNLIGSELYYKETLTLPLHPDLTNNDIDFVGKSIIDLLKKWN